MHDLSTCSPDEIYCNIAFLVPHFFRHGLVCFVHDARDSMHKHELTSLSQHYSALLLLSSQFVWRSSLQTALLYIGTRSFLSSAASTSQPCDCAFTDSFEKCVTTCWNLNERLWKSFGERWSQTQEVRGICLSRAPHPLHTSRRQTDSGRNDKIYLWWVIICGRPPQINNCMQNSVYFCCQPNSIVNTSSSSYTRPKNDIYDVIDSVIPLPENLLSPTLKKQTWNLWQSCLVCLKISVFLFLWVSTSVPQLSCFHFLFDVSSNCFFLYLHSKLQQLLLCAVKHGAALNLLKEA